MTVHFYTFSDAQGGSSRQRAFYISNELNARGMHSIVHTPSSSAVSSTPWPKKATLITDLLRSFTSIKKTDVVYIQRAISNKYFFFFLTVYVVLFGRTMIFDLDDPTYLHSFFKTMLLTRLADAVVVNHSALAEWARQYNSNVHVIHISLNYAHYKKFEHDYTIERTPLVVGWVGTGKEHRFNLAFLADVLKEVRAKPEVPDFSLALIGVQHYEPLYEMFNSIVGLETHFVDTLDWNDLESVPREVQNFDIGVLPNATDPAWSRLKSSFKIIEYMACGVASISSDFGEMPNIIQDGVNGYLAESEEDWVEKLTRLLCDKDLRVRLGHAGQESVRKNYCFDAVIPKYMKIIRSLDESIDKHI